MKDIKNCEICANPTEWVPCDSKRNPYAAVCADTHCLVCLQAYGCEVRGFEHPARGWDDFYSKGLDALGAKFV